MVAAVTLKDVTFTYATATTPSVSHLSFEVDRGSVCALIGANGSGKTTVCNIVRGFAPRFFTGELTGEVLIDGESIDEHHLGQLAERIGFVFQNPFVQISGSKDTVFDEVAFGLENLGVPVDEIRERVWHTLRLVGIEQLAQSNPLELSGGQKQRVALSAILAMDPPIFVIDEPTSQLDPQGTEDIFDIIETLKNQGKTIILVEHKIELVARYADQVVVLDGGTIAMDGPAATILGSPELVTHHVAPPAYAELTTALRAQGHDDVATAVTKEEALVALRPLAAGITTKEGVR